jgi:hypothetical protein
MELIKSKDMGDLAALGYYSFIADIYGELPEDNAEAGQKSGYYKTNYKEYQKRISLDQLIKPVLILIILW